ncbi:MAG: 2-amino-4-hydroxy-6-hydroxymethyldihydropteridine diphosphokinase [Bryobacteraceae bacterium]
MKIIYLSLGSNIGNREEALQQALRHLHAADLQIRRISSVYETKPVDFTSQPWFLNLVAEAETSLFPIRLLQRTQNVERKMGRKRLGYKGPRVIDIDILLYGGFRVNTARLDIPHPRLTERRFVLEPLVELVPEMRHPVSRRTMRELLPATAAQAVHKILFRPELPG